MTTNSELLELAENIEKFRFNYIDLRPSELLELAPDAERAATDALTDGKPERQIFGVSAKGGEELVAQWLRWLQFANVEVTPERRDGGFDVIADNYLVQVKTLSRDYVGVAPVREIYGVAQSEEKLPMFWVRGTLSDDALAFANKVEMPVFQFSPEEGLINPANDSASTLLETRMKIRSFKYILASKIGVAKGAAQMLTATFNMLETASQHFDYELRLSINKEMLIHRTKFPASHDPWFEGILRRVSQAPDTDAITLLMPEVQSICVACDEVFSQFHNYLTNHKVEITSGMSNIYDQTLDTKPSAEED
jgi:hypothetical protein